MSDLNGYAVSAFAAYKGNNKTKSNKKFPKKQNAKNPLANCKVADISTPLPSKSKQNKNKKKKPIKSEPDTSLKSKISKLVAQQTQSLLSQPEVNSEEEFAPKKVKKNKRRKTSSSSSTTSVANQKQKKRKIDFDSKEEVELANNVTEKKSDPTDSSEKGKDVFKWIIDPVPIKQFFKNTWEKTSIHIDRHGDSSYFHSLLSTPQIDQILRQNNLFFGKNIDITSFTEDKRQTHNPDGKAFPAMVWDYYSNGCSVRLLNPQSYSRKLHQAISYLQEYFGTFVGANAYLTPPDSQGFAPHYDDIEAFILQIEGKKHWKLYAPSNPEDTLPRFSSPNFSEKDLPEPTMEVTLQAGDLLYFPRGTIHQGSTVPGEHSLHVTLSFYQKTSWTDFLEKLVPETLKIVSEADPAFREGLPLHFMNYMGEANLDDKSPERVEFFKKLESLIYKLFVKAPVDTMIDQLGKQFQHDALPPVLTSEEKQLSAYEDGDRMQKNGKIVNRVEISLDTKVKLLRKHIIRLVNENDVARIYHYAYNSKIYHEEEPQYFEIDETIIPAIKMLIRRYPLHTKVEDLPTPTKDTTTLMTVIADLWERGLLLTDESLPILED